MNEPHNFYLFIFFIYTLGHSSCGGDTCHSYYNNNNQPIYLHIFKSHTHTHTLCVCRNLNLFPFFHWWNLFKFVYHFYFDQEKSMTSLFYTTYKSNYIKKRPGKFSLVCGWPIRFVCVIWGRHHFLYIPPTPINVFSYIFSSPFFSIG